MDPGGESCSVDRLQFRILRVGGSVVALAVLMLAAAIPAAGQLLTSRVDGRVLDQTGAVVPGVTVTLTNADTNVSRETATNSSGLYVFPNVSQGTYSVEVTADGFKAALVEDVQVALGAPANVDIVVEVGVVTQTVVVTAAETQSVMNEVNAEINTNLNREQVKASSPERAQRDPVGPYPGRRDQPRRDALGRHQPAAEAPSTTSPWTESTTRTPSSGPTPSSGSFR